MVIIEAKAEEEEDNLIIINNKRGRGRCYRNN